MCILVVVCKPVRLILLAVAVAVMLATALTAAAYVDYYGGTIADAIAVLIVVPTAVRTIRRNHER